MGGAADHLREHPATKLVEFLEDEDIAQAYNRDDSDSMVDHFDVHFYTHVSYSY
ncbi:hypothetical protein [Nocardia sp. NPDC003979]